MSLQLKTYFFRLPAKKRISVPLDERKAEGDYQYIKSFVNSNDLLTKKNEETEIDVNNRNKVLLNGTLQDNNLPK